MVRVRERRVGRGQDEKTDAYMGIGTLVAVIFCVASFGPEVVLIGSIVAGLSWMVVSGYTLHKMHRLRQTLRREKNERERNETVDSTVLCGLLRDQTILSLVILGGFIAVVSGYMCLALKGKDQFPTLWCVCIALIPIVLFLFGYGSNIKLVTTDEK